MQCKFLENETREYKLAISRLLQLRNELFSRNEYFYADGDILFCQVCSKVIDHSRQGTINRHNASDVHMKKLAPKKQTTIITTMTAQTTAKIENLALVSDFVRKLTAANLPLNTADNPQVRTFLKSHIRCGGAIPSRTKLIP